MKLAHVCIMTPSYDGKVTTGFMESIILQMQQKTHRTSFRYLEGDSLVARARNSLFKQFVDEMDEEGLPIFIWQDSDISLPFNSITSMLSRNVDVIASPVPLKQEITRHGWNQSVTGIQREIEPMFYTAKYAATGCFMLSRYAIEKVIEFCEKNNQTYLEGDKRWDVFRVGCLKNNFYLSEDWYLCWMLREIGFDIYIDSSFAVIHIESSRVYWERPAAPISELIIEGKQEQSLDKSIKYQRWTTNDFELGEIEI